MQKDRRTPAGAGRKSATRLARTNNPWKASSQRAALFAQLKSGISFPMAMGLPQVHHLPTKPPELEHSVVLGLFWRTKGGE